MSKVVGRLGVFLAVFVMLFAVTTSKAYCQGNVAFVTGGGDLNDGYDVGFNDFMVNLGYTVTLIDAADVGGTFDVAAAETYDLVVYSESPSSSSVGPLTNGGTSLPNVPFIHCEGFGWDNIGLFAGTAGWIPDSESAATVTAAGAAHSIFQAAGISAGAFTILTTNSNTDGNLGTTQDGPVADVQVLMTAGTTIPNAPVVWILEGGVRTGYDSPVVGLSTPHGAPVTVDIPFSDFTSEYLTLLEEILQYLAPLGPPPPLPPEPENILIVGARQPEALGDDTVLFDTVDSALMLDHNVSYVNVNNVDNNALIGIDLVIISESIGSGDGGTVNTNLMGRDIPIIFMEPAIVGAIGFGTGGGGAGTGVADAAPDASIMTIVDDTDPVAEGFSNGPVTIVNAPVRILWADGSTSQAHVVAQFNDDQGTEMGLHDTLVYYEPGATMTVGTAVNYRGFFPMDRGTWGDPLNATADCLSLLENMINLFTPETGIVNSVDKGVWTMME